MALRDHYDEADVLDTLSWVGLSIEGRIARLASLYLDNEHEMRRNHNRYEGPTLGCVRIFVKSVYDPPRGQGQLTYEGVLKAIPGQRKTRNERQRRPQPYVWKKKSLKARRTAVARAKLTVWTYCRWDENDKKKADIECVGIASVGGCRIIAIKGDESRPKRLPRFWVQDLATGRANVVVVEGKPITSITQLLTRIAPKGALRGAFDGKSITFSFGGGWIVDGEFEPWRNIRGVYPASMAHRTQGNPKKKGQEPDA
jgi:hypothetical protein